MDVFGHRTFPRTIWDWLTRPNPRVAPLQQARSRLLTILVFITLPVMCLVSSWVSAEPVALAFRWTLPVIYAGIFLVNRSGYFRAAAWMLILVLALQPFIYLITVPAATFETITFGGIWLIAPFLMAYVLLAVRDFALTLALVFGLVATVLLTHPEVGFSALSTCLLVLFWMAVVLLVAAVMRRDDVQRQLDHASALEESEARYRSLFAATLEGIVIHRNGIIVECNRTFAALLGYEVNALPGTSIVECIAPEDRARVVALVNSTEMFQAQGLRRNGSVFWAEVRNQPIQLNGELLRVSAVVDITGRREIERQQVRLKVEQEKVLTLRELINNLSHDLRNPLSNINTGLYLIRKLQNDPIRVEAQIQQVEEQVDHLKAMVEDLQIMATLDRRATSEYRFTWRNVNPVVDAAVQEEREPALRRRQMLTFAGADDLPDALLDSAEFKRLVKHLIQNAVNFTPEGGEIAVTTQADGNDVLVRVSDTGIGISTEDRARIFDYFYRADEARNPETGGTGLGLTIAKRIADAHNGRIEVESTPGAGSVFCVRLPVTRRLTSSSPAD